MIGFIIELCIVYLEIMFYFRIVYCVFGNHVLFSYFVLCIWGFIICFIIELCTVYLEIMFYFRIVYCVLGNHRMFYYRIVYCVLGNHRMFYNRIVYCVFGDSPYVLLSNCVLCIWKSCFIFVLCTAYWGIIVCFIFVLCTVY